MYGAAKVGAGVASALGAVVLALVVVAGGTGSSVAAQGAVGVTVLGQLAAGRVRGQRSGAEPLGGTGHATPRPSWPRPSRSVRATDGAQIALMVAYTESSLENLGPEPGNDGSLGLFQQRAAAGWGTPSEEQDPTDAAGMFVERLLSVPSWQSIAPWVAAQDVQDSAFNGVPSASNHGSSVVGGNYKANWTPGRHILGSHRRIGGQHGLRRGERRRAGRPGELLRVARGLRHPAGRHTG